MSEFLVMHGGITVKIIGGYHIPPEVIPILKERPPCFMIKRGQAISFEVGNEYTEEVGVILTIDGIDMGGDVVVAERNLSPGEQSTGYSLTKGSKVTIDSHYDGTGKKTPLVIGLLPTNFRQTPGHIVVSVFAKGSLWVKIPFEYHCVN